MGSTVNQPASTSDDRPLLPEKIPAVLPPLFFAALFFLCSADLVFATRIHGLNFRWGQLLLFGTGCFSAAHLFRQGEISSEKRRLLKQIGLAWAPFALFYILGACLSTHPALGLLKFGWAVFNLGGAALVVLGGSCPAALQRGFRWGILSLAAFVLIQSLCLFVFPDIFHVTGEQILYKRFALTAHPFGLSIPLGIGQSGDSWEGTPLFRPCAFYYEPNYLSCALALALSLLIFRGKRTRWYSGWAPSLVLVAVVLSTSRGGILGCGFTLAALGTVAFLGPLKEKKLLLVEAVLFAALTLGFLLLSGGIRHSLGYLTGPLGTSAIQENLNTPHTSEGDRVEGFFKGFQVIQEHLWLGQGYQPSVGSTGMAPGTLNTWIEIGTESGVLGILGFVFAVLYTLQTSLPAKMGKETLIFLLTAGVVLFGINYNLASNFPRLDYWLLFFYSILLARTLSPLPVR